MFYSQVFFFMWKACGNRQRYICLICKYIIIRIEGCKSSNLGINKALLAQK